MTTPTQYHPPVEDPYGASRMAIELRTVSDRPRGHADLIKQG